jgi:hypothetical protein
MEIETVSEALDFSFELMRLTAREDFITFSRSESLKYYKFIITLYVQPR